MSTPEQHAALFLEILSEMSPEQLASAVHEANQPLKLDLHLDFDLSAEPSYQAKRLDYLHGAAIFINPNLTAAAY